MPRDKVTNDLLPPAEDASNLTTIGSTQPLENAIERLRQGRQSIFHNANVLASSVLSMTHQSAAVPATVGDCHTPAPKRSCRRVSVCNPRLRDSSFLSLVNKPGSNSYAGD